MVTINGEEYSQKQIDDMIEMMWRDTWDLGGVYRRCVPEGLAKQFEKEEPTND